MTEADAMRYATVLLWPPSGDDAFHPLGRRLTDEPAVTRGPIHRVDLLDDGTAVLLGEVAGDLDRYREIHRASPHVVDFTVAGDGSGFAYTHFEPTELGTRLLTARRRTELTLEMPIRVTDDGAFEVTVVGPAGLFEGFDALPDDVEVTLVESGRYDDDAQHLYGRLTDTQRKILDVAVETGYFEEPRRTTLSELADRLDRSPGTVGEHLRKIQSRVFSELVDG